jgi:hypothetical protein
MVAVIVVAWLLPPYVLIRLSILFLCGLLLRSPLNGVLENCCFAKLNSALFQLIVGVLLELLGIFIARSAKCQTRIKVDIDYFYSFNDGAPETVVKNSYEFEHGDPPDK